MNSFSSGPKCELLSPHCLTGSSYILLPAQRNPNFPSTEIHCLLYQFIFYWPHFPSHSASSFPLPFPSSIIWSVCFSPTPTLATENIFPKGALDWESRWTPEWIPAGHSVLEKLYQHFEFSFLICKNDWVGKTERFLIWNLAPAFLVLTGLLLFPTCVFCVLLFATLLSPSFSLFRVFLVIPLSLYLSPQSSSPFSYCPYPFNPITVFLSNSLSNLKRCFIRIVRFLCIRTWNTLMNSFFFLLEIFFNKCWYYVLNFYLFIWLH